MKLYMHNGDESEPSFHPATASEMTSSLKPTASLLTPPKKKRGGKGSVRGEITTWLVVEPTPLKNMLVKLGSSSLNRGEHEKCLKPPPSYTYRGET